MRLMRRTSLGRDLPDATRFVVDDEEVTTKARHLAALEEEHRLLSERRR